MLGVDGFMRRERIEDNLWRLRGCEESGSGSGVSSAIAARNRVNGERK